jgi:hypothetical protein
MRSPCMRVKLLKHASARTHCMHPLHHACLMQEALKRAMAENPELAKEFEHTLAKRIAQAGSVEEKEKGNRLFSEKKFDLAIKSFTKCIELDPRSVRSMEE